MTLKPCDEWGNIPSSVEACINRMNSKMLKLNKNKTEFIVFSPKGHLKKIENLHIKVGSGYINSSVCEKSGVYIR